MIHTADQDGPDMKLICVPVDKIDPRRSHIQSVNDLNTHLQEELLGFFKEYKKLEKGKYDKVQIDGFKSIDHAHTLIDQAIKNAQ